ncbi:hypothetical protein GCM10010174_21670 [Kutzneria viridogrisea]
MQLRVVVLPCVSGLLRMGVVKVAARSSPELRTPPIAWQAPSSVPAAPDPAVRPAGPDRAADRDGESRLPLRLTCHSSLSGRGPAHAVDPFGPLALTWEIGSPTGRDCSIQVVDAAPSAGSNVNLVHGNEHVA